MNILIVEDETMVGMLIEDMILSLDHHPVGPCSSVKEALATIGRESIDVALLDVNLGGERVFPVADTLDNLNIPYALVSGYDPEGIDGKYRHATKLQKPFNSAEFKTVVAELQSRHEQAS